MKGSTVGWLAASFVAGLINIWLMVPLLIAFFIATTKEK